jgi:hypothetical protein
VHGLVEFGGLGFQHLYVESKVKKLKSIIFHVNKNTELGETMKIILTWIHLHSGSSTNTLQSRSSFDYIQENWFKEIHKFI